MSFSPPTMHFVDPPMAQHCQKKSFQYSARYNHSSPVQKVHGTCVYVSHTQTHLPVWTAGHVQIHTISRSTCDPWKSIGQNWIYSCACVAYTHNICIDAQVGRIVLQNYSPPPPPQSKQSQYVMFGSSLAALPQILLSNNLVSLSQILFSLLTIFLSPAVAQQGDRNVQREKVTLVLLTMWIGPSVTNHEHVHILQRLYKYTM